MVTIYDIAKKCGVSPSTVSKVINNYGTIPDETKKKILKAMEEMNYIPNVSAKSLSKGSSRNVGILAFLGVNISPFKHHLFIDILDQFQSIMNANNYDLLFVAKSVAGKDGSFLQNCISRDVAGVLMFGDMESDELKEVINSNIPKVGFDYLGEKMTGVTSDNYNQMKILTNHLIKLGHKNIVFVHGEENRVTAIRIQAFKDALAEAGIPFDERMLEESRYMDEQSIANITSNILHRVNVPTAIMFPDDVAALGGLKAIQAAGYNCPKDISITGFDGISISQLVTPHLTTVRQDTFVIAQMLAKSLIASMEKKNHAPEVMEVRGSLIIGESTAVPRK
ncbi:MAG: LacI family transcriptional regulator [Bacilli bacterium]|nr:LacI family transcriptional regulator [Bacilli bacterium]